MTVDPIPSHTYICQQDPPQPTGHCPPQQGNIEGENMFHKGKEFYKAHINYLVLLFDGIPTTFFKIHRTQFQIKGGRSARRRDIFYASGKR